MLLVSKDDLYECRGFIGDMIGWLPGEGGHTINEDQIINNIRCWLEGRNYVIGKADKHISYLLNQLYRYLYHLPEEKGEIDIDGIMYQCQNSFKFLSGDNQVFG